MPGTARTTEAQTTVKAKSANTVSNVPHPYAAAFLKEHLGPVKFASFSAKLFERRLGGSKPRARTKDKHEVRLGSNGATVVEFLIKTEVVKEVLRTYVPFVHESTSALLLPSATLTVSCDSDTRMLA